MKLELLYATDLSSAEVKELKSLTLRGKGELAGELQYRRDTGDKRARVIRLTQGDRVVSWALVSKFPSGEWDFQIYTRVSERHKGYGSIVYRKAVQVAHGRHNLVVYPNIDNNYFFDHNHFDENGDVIQSKKKSGTKRK